MAEAVIMASKALNPKQEAFVNEYMISFNGTKAAVKAGYAPASAAVTASRMLNYDNVIEALAERRQEANQEAGVTQAMVIKELAKIAFSDVRNVLGEGGALKDPSEWDDDTAGSVSSLEIASAGDMATIHKLKTYDKVAALDKLARHLGLFEDGGGTKANIQFNFGRLERGVL
jgi:phage terminase small subunit